MPACTERPRRATDCLWRGVGVVYLAVLLVGLGAGLWPGVVHHSQAHRTGAPLPTLQAVAVAQSAFLLLAWPISLAFRSDGRRGPPRPAEAIGELALLIVAAIPFYLAAGYFSDAALADMVRTAAAVCGGLPLALAAGLWMVRCRPARPAALMAVLILTLGVPAAYYIVREFLGAASAGSVGVLWQISPITFAWSAGRSQVRHWVPQPVWPLAVWGLVAVAGVLMNLVIGPKERCNS